MKPNAIPDGYHTITPYLMVREGDRLLKFLKDAFDAREMRMMRLPNGRIGNAEIRVGDSMLMLAENPDHAAPPAHFYLYVPDTDALYRQALAAGGTSVLEPRDQYYGDRNAGVTDPAGNTWWIATRIEEVSDEEIARRAASVKK